jgi:hypothetical protein
MQTTAIGRWGIEVLCVVGCLCLTAATARAASLSVTAPPQKQDFGARFPLCVHLESEGEQFIELATDLVWDPPYCLASTGQCEAGDPNRPIQHSVSGDAQLTILLPAQGNPERIPDGELFCCERMRIARTSGSC